MQAACERGPMSSGFDLFADAAPGVVEDGVLVAGDWRVQLLQDYLDTAVAVDEAPDVVHHGSFTEHAGALVGWPAPHRPTEVV